MTDTSQLNRMLERSRAEAEKELPLLTAVYEKALRLLAADASRTFSSLTAATWQPEPEGSLLRAVDAVAASIAVTQSRLQKRILKLVAGDPLARLGIAWDVKHPLSEDLLARAGSRTGQRLGAAATPILRDTVGKAYEQGLSVPDTAALIRANLEDAAPWQAEMLARTDLNGLANGGSVIAATLAGAGYKTWLATMDDRTRETHAEADGQTVPVAHAFTVGGEQLEYPGDPNGSDAEVANCRCSVIYRDTLTASASRFAAASIERSDSFERSLLGRHSGPIKGVLRASRHSENHVRVLSFSDEEWAEIADQLAGLSSDDLVSVYRVPVGRDRAGAIRLRLIDHPVANDLAHCGDEGKIGVYDEQSGLVANAAALRKLATRSTFDSADRERSLAVNDAGEVSELLAAGHASDDNTVIHRAGGRAPMGGLSSRGTMAKSPEDSPTRKGMTVDWKGFAAATLAPLTAATLAQTKWVSDLAFEGEATSDGRYMLPRSLKARELPLTLMAQTVTDDGHDGAFVAGRIDTISRRGMNIDGDPLAEGVMSMRGTGIFDMGGENGADIARLVGDQILRGVSVDLGILAWCFRDPATGELIEPEDMTDDQWEQAFFGELQYAVKNAEILAATVCPTPAFANARIALTASAAHHRVIRVWAPLKLEPEETVSAAYVRIRPLTAAAAPSKPPREWFETQEPPGEMPLTITDEGRVFGHIALWKTCHTGIANVCTTPPRSASGYAYFHVGELELDGGEKIAVGKLMLASKGGKHAPLSASRAEAAQHYDDSSMVAAYLRASDGQHGIWVAGALNPSLSPERVRELRTLPPSGDWRAVDGRLDMIAALAVPVPGFPIARAEAALIASAEELTLSSLVASSGSFDPSPLVIRALAAAGLIVDDPSEDARTRALVARAEGGIDGLLALATGDD